MGRVKAIIRFELANAHLRGDETIYQGQISFGPHSQLTYLGSCVAIIIFCKKWDYAGLSHVVGHKTRIGDFNLAHEVLDFYQKLAVEHAPFEYYLIGGSDNCAHVLSNTETELKRRNITYRCLDVLGMSYRQVKIIPRDRTILLYKKRMDEILNKQP